jgi:hypothetical protein
LPDPRREGADAFVVGLLSPARSGMILLHRDLARAAEHAGIGVRSGGRRMTLTALLSEAPKAAMEWLAEETRSRVPQHEELLSGCGPIQEHWIDRGGAAAALLDDLASRVGSGVLA